MKSRNVIVSGGFDNLRSCHVRLFEMAAEMGELTVLLWPDEALAALLGAPPKFPLAERQYFVEAVRFVRHVKVAPASVDPNWPFANFKSQIANSLWVDEECSENSARAAAARHHGVEYEVIPSAQLAIPSASPESGIQSANSATPKVIVTGCYDWLHSGHVRFFEEVSAYGDLYVIVGHDANIRTLKGEGHPLQPQHERRYMAGAIRYVKQALIASGDGWLDADPEIQQLKPDIYAVNEDGDRGGKREYCARHGLRYLVLKREPAPGLPRRSSTDLRGF